MTFDAMISTHPIDESVSVVDVMHLNEYFVVKSLL
jgi:hypothetical protein